MGCTDQGELGEMIIRKVERVRVTRRREGKNERGRRYMSQSLKMRFNTTAGNPVKKILLKLNLSDHRLFKDGGGGS
ncbi:hypothetical protein Tco_0787820 [Tanacetum coccineum]